MVKNGGEIHERSDKMSDFIPMMGTYTYNLDSKNRIFIPAKHREALGGNFVVFPNPKDMRSLIISTVEYLDTLIKKIADNEEISSEDRSDMIGYLSGFGDTLTTDTQGRVVLAGALVEHAGLGGSTVIHGCYTHSEIWNAAVFQATTRDRASGLAEAFKKSKIVL